MKGKEIKLGPVLDIAIQIASALDEAHSAGIVHRDIKSAADKNVPPVVYGEWIVPGAKRTIVFYAHYDGQPTDANDWTGNAPWDPVLRSGPLEKDGKSLPFPKSGEAIDPEWRV